MFLKKLIFATNNKHKLDEVRAILANDFEVLSLEDIGCIVDIPETGTTLEENAKIKAQYVKNNYKFDCFADDTGLEVEALNNAPGVHSARYAGEDKDSQKNIEKLLSELKGKENRKARFRTVVALIIDDEEHCFEGEVRGVIANSCKGNSGFGYDPVFVPEGYDKTFAELSLETKNTISHRALAIDKLCKFLKNE
ncbi:non-canonical purine NTP diphosphatase [Dysgonomonas sp. 520]|uniref:non-canonical purine NTP diphosphatase n=1 Tax=Dysgonomonas sp. 520 TaxID=2302931 RepID=UPI0013D6BFE3|nr:non-canonical purine NTP diphosphatase [Dysgonomonas sp. 520]NDW08535.1 non-canonical purine NTP diphosphatase [Dysgonomonas sp. 520]